MQHGSIVNQIYSETINQPKPFIGMDATVCGFSDRDAGKIVEIFTKGSFTYFEVKSVGYGAGGVFRRKVDSTDRWEPCQLNVDTGRWSKSKYGSVILGVSDPYYDPHF
jgi:hypothetical protein